MSHFASNPVKLTKEDIPQVEEIVKEVASSLQALVLKGQARTNWYGVSQYFLIGMESEKINPIGFVLSGNDLNLVADLETNHQLSERKAKTEQAYQMLTQRVRECRQKKARDKALEWAQVQNQSGANVSVIQH